MKKAAYALTPFCIYSFFVLLLYFLTHFLFPKLKMELTTYFFVFFATLYILIGTFVFGFILGKITQKRFSSPKIIYSLLFAVFSCLVMLMIGGMYGIFAGIRVTHYRQINIDDFIWGISSSYTIFNAIGTFCSFFLGELYEYFILKKKQKEDEGME